MAKFITVVVTDTSGEPEYYAEVNVWKDGFFTGGKLATEHTDRNGTADFSLDVSNTDKIAFSAKCGGRSGETSFDYPVARVRIVID